jgi:hypothetical protein
MLRKLTAVSFIAASLAGCAGPPPPNYSDAFKGIYNRNSASVRADVPVSVQQPVGIIFSDNVEAYFGFIKDSNEYWSARIPSSLTNTVVIADTDPRYLGARLLAMLKGHFPNSSVIKDFNQAVATGKRAVIVIDLRMKPMEPYGDRSIKLDLDAYFFDARMNPISKLSGHGEHYVPYASMDAGVQKVINAAVQQLDAKISALARP